MSKPEGIYLSVDYRVSKNGALVDDASVKFLTVHFPPEKTGPRALIAYTGVAFAPDATPVGDWLMQTMRGQTETFDASMQHLRSRLDRDFGGYLHRRRTPLIVNVLAIERDWRFLGGFTNLKKDGRISRSFDYVMEQLTEPCVFGNGSGTARAVADGHMALLIKHLDVRPRRPHNHMKLLAAVNRRVASHEPSVSPHCHVSFINADDRFGPQSETFVEPGKSMPFHMPMLVFGIDLSFMFEQFMRDIASGAHPLSSLNPEEVNKNLKRRQ
jgi:hypothetical protein